MSTTAPYPSLIDEQLAEIETRFQVQSKGRMWHIHDRLTGKTAGFCVSHKAALIRARQLERAHG